MLFGEASEIIILRITGIKSDSKAVFHYSLKKEQK